MNLNEMAVTVHQANSKWWQDPATGQPINRNNGELLMLVITELAEAVEGIRKDLMDDKLPHRKMEEVEMADAFIRLLDYAGGFKLKLDKPDWFKVPAQLDWPSDNKAECVLMLCAVVTAGHTGFQIPSAIGGHQYEILACLLAIEGYCIKFNLDLEGAIKEKMEYNRTRADHTHEARMAAGGKKF